MEKSVVAAVLAALGAGIAIGVQGAVMRTADRAVGALRTGLLVNIAGGSLSLLALFALSLLGGGVLWGALLRSSPFWGVAGALGIGILTGMAFALPRLGIAAGLGGIILGQMTAAVVIDAAGWGASRIPLSASRLAGLLLMAVAVVLLLPRR
ncbi:MAG: DMT family transporter [Deinococcales bacterium]